MNKFKIKELLEDHQELHSEFQIDNFIIGNQGDRWAQYKQCLREIKSRWESIESDKMQADRLAQPQKPFKLFWPSKANLEKRRIAKSAGRKKLKSLYDTIKDREREPKRFLEHAVG